jgi:hypothetical protein
LPWSSNVVVEVVVIGVLVSVSVVGVAVVLVVLSAAPMIAAENSMCRPCAVVVAVMSAPAARGGCHGHRERRECLWVRRSSRRCSKRVRSCGGGGL